MFNLITTAYAQGTVPAASPLGGSSSWMSFIPIVLMIVIFYFLLIRPQQKKEKDRKSLINAIEKGDKVITTGGIYATVSSVKSEEVVVLKIADGTKVEFSRNAIQGKIS